MNNNIFKPPLVKIPFLLIVSLTVLLHSNSTLSFEQSIQNDSLLSLYEFKHDIENQNTFYGLASYYNNLYLYQRTSKGFKPILFSDSLEFNLKDSEIAIISRFKILYIKSSLDKKIKITLSPFSLNIEGRSTSIEVKSIDKSDTELIAHNNLGELKYIHLWKPIAELSKLSEKILLKINSQGAQLWPLTVFFFAVFVCILLYPLKILASRSQEKVNQNLAILQPRLNEIRKRYDGEEAHNLILATYNELNISPFHTLRPCVLSIIQLPFFIAIFNTLGEMPQFIDQPFLWVKDLSSPDSLFVFPVAIPWFGNQLNIFPLIMSATSLLIIFYSSSFKRQENRITLYFMTVAFLFLFYPFPAVMVYYWTVANIIPVLLATCIRLAKRNNKIYG